MVPWRTRAEHNGMAYWVIGLGWLMRVESPSPFTCKSFNAKLMQTCLVYMFSSHNVRSQRLKFRIVGLDLANHDNS